MNQPLDPFPTSPRYPNDDRTPNYWPDFDLRPPRPHRPKRTFPRPFFPRKPGEQQWDDDYELV